MKKADIMTPKIVKSPIISCSRRTDIPAFYMNWVIERMKEGHVDVPNPFNYKQISRVSLKPKDVKCWVWWSKDFKEWIRYYKENLELFKMYDGHFFQFTINSPSELEGKIRSSLEERLDQLKWLIQEFGSLAISYRFDPIVFYKSDGSLIIKNNLNKFKYLIEKVSTLGIKEVTFSFATLYSKVKKRMINKGFIPVDLSLKMKIKILNKLLKICNENNIQMKACCQPELLAIEGIEQAHCIDAFKIEKLIGKPIKKIRDTGQRTGCGCYKSKDIGQYSGKFRCKHQCIYCYASPLIK